MGIPDYHYTSTGVYEPSFVDYDKLQKLDCKALAIELASHDSSLSVRRGYALFDDGFTEHWWIKARTGKVLDITPLRSIREGEPTYIELPFNVDSVSICDALVGDCHVKPMCAWCRLRMKLERQGHGRVPMAELSMRVVVDVLFRENAKLRHQLAKAIRPPSPKAPR